MAAAQLSHQNVTEIFDIHEADGTDYVALEPVEGETSTDVLAPEALSLVRIVDLALPLADALAYAHERGVPHRNAGQSARATPTATSWPSTLPPPRCAAAAGGASSRRVAKVVAVR